MAGRNPTCTSWVHFDGCRKLHHGLLVQSLHQIALPTKVVAVRVIGILLDRDIVRLTSLFEVATVKVLPTLGVGRHGPLSTRTASNSSDATLSATVALSRFLAAP